MKYRQFYEEMASVLKEAGVPEYELDARLLLEYRCGTDINTLLLEGESEVDAQKESEVRELVARRSQRIPLAYIVGTQAFMGLNFKVTDKVLIPNQDTETLVEEALREIHDGMRFMDLCTGSGCIALSILNYTNSTTCVATDISKDALYVAESNADIFCMNDRIEFCETDLFPGREPEKFDMIISNPPYIPTDVIETLAPEVRLGEPRLALDGDADGLTFYRRIIAEAPKWLYESGWLMMEIGYDQGESVPALMKEGGFREIEVIQDLGGNPRVVRGCWY
jgi:release factor glutamine methyltransferase